jgi:3-methyladenine DNA glycosylase AlkD
MDYSTLLDWRAFSLAKGKDSRSEVAEVKRRLRALSDPKAARMAKAALRSPHAFHGVIPPQVRALAREIARRHRQDPNLEALLSTARALWKSPWHEERSTAITMVAALTRRLDADHWTEFKAWLKGVRSPDHCDGIAVDLLGSLVKRDRSWVRVLKHWTLSKSAWERRAAVMAVLLRTRQMGDVEAAFYICESLMRDRARPVQEAVVAVLAEARASDQEATQDFQARWKGKGAPALLKDLPTL